MNFLWTGAGSSAGIQVEMYLIIFALLLVCELIYFRIADKCNIIDKPNGRSSHTSVVLRGGGIIFLIGAWILECFLRLRLSMVFGRTDLGSWYQFCG